MSVVGIDQANIGTLGDDTSAATIALTTTQNVAPGGFIILGIGWGDATKTLSSMAGGSLPWTIDKQGNAANGSNGCCALVSAQAPSGLPSGTVLTASYSGATVGRAIGGLSFTGITASSPVDATSGPTDFAATATWTTASMRLAGGSVQVAVSHCTSTNDTSTITAPSIEALDFGGGAGTFGQTVGYRIEPTGGAFTIAGTYPGNEQGTVVSVAYTAAVSSLTHRMPLGV